MVAHASGGSAKIRGGVSGAGLFCDIDIQFDALARLQITALGQGIPFPQFSHRDFEFTGDAGQGVALAHRVVYGPYPRTGVEVFGR